MPAELAALNALGDLLILRELLNRERRSLALTQSTFDLLLCDEPPDGIVVFAGSDDEVVARAVTEGCVLVGHDVGARWRGRISGSPDDRSTLTGLDHPFAELMFYGQPPCSVEYRRIRLHRIAPAGVVTIEQGVLLGDSGQEIKIHDMEFVGASERAQADSLRAELRKEYQARQAALEEQRAQQAAEQAVEFEKRRVEQAAASTYFDGWEPDELDDDDDDADDDDVAYDDPPITELGHRRILEEGSVVWRWWCPEGIDTGGPMVREYSDAVVRWCDGDFYYLQIGDSGGHMLVPLGSYDKVADAIAAGQRHSLYTDQEREALDAQS